MGIESISAWTSPPAPKGISPLCDINHQEACVLINKQIQSVTGKTPSNKLQGNAKDISNLDNNQVYQKETGTSWKQDYLLCLFEQSQLPYIVPLHKQNRAHPAASPLRCTLHPPRSRQSHTTTCAGGQNTQLQLTLEDFSLSFWWGKSFTEPIQQVHVFPDTQQTLTQMSLWAKCLPALHLHQGNLAVLIREAEKLSSNKRKTGKKCGTPHFIRKWAI